MITGVHGYVPQDVLTNQDLEQLVDTSDAWIQARTGIRERRILRSPNAGTSVMGIEAVSGLLQKTSTDPASIDLLICATITPDMPTPATANLIAHAVGAHRAFSYDLQAACSGFLFALVTAAQFIESGRCCRVVVVGADKMSSITDYQDRTTCVLFGDGAGAVLLEPATNGRGLIDSVLASDGAGVDHLYQAAGGSKMPASPQTVADRAHYVRQNGPVVFKIAVKKMVQAVQEVMRRNHLSNEDLRFLVPHQANARILHAVANLLDMDTSKVMMNVDTLGNTTAATLPLCLWQYGDRLLPGDKLILVAFGGGFTWGASYVIW